MCIDLCSIRDVKLVSIPIGIIIEKVNFGKLYLEKKGIFGVIKDNL